jgi:hypothetical protein
MKKGKPPGDYEVGYGKPPKHTQWPKGTSGNRDGRPKKKTSIEDLLLAECRKTHRIIEDGVQKKVTGNELLAKRIWRAIVQESSSKSLLASLEFLRKLEAEHSTPLDGIPKHGVLVVTGRLSEEEWERQTNVYNAAGDDI